MDETQLIEKFCETLDASHIRDLAPEFQELLIAMALKAIKTPGAKKHIAKKILFTFGLGTDGNELEVDVYTEKAAKDTLAAFSVALTGARPGDIIVGKSNASWKAKIRVHTKEIKPQEKHVRRLRQYPAYWDQYMIKLGGIPFFTDMSIAEREEWVNNNVDPSDVSIGEVGAELELVQPGEGDFVKKLSPQVIETLISGNPDHPEGLWTSSEIEKLFPGKPGSKAKKDTLILFRGMWRLALGEDIVAEYPGTVLDVSAGTISESGEVDNPQAELIYVFDDLTKKYEKKQKKIKGVTTALKPYELPSWERPAGKGAVQKVGVLVPITGKPLTTSLLDELIAEHYPTDAPEYTPEDLQFIRASMKNFTGAAYKSLLQKIIRFDAKQVLINGKLFPTELVLLVTIGETARYPGSFVPDIQRYVSGLENLAKRMAVSIFEDSSVPEEENYRLLSLLSGALMAQRDRSWMVTREILGDWMDTGLLAYNRQLAYIHNWRKNARAPYVVDPEATVLENCSALLDELKSFAGDLFMVRDIAMKDSSIKMSPPESAEMPQPDVMPFEHLVDQHWAPNIVYFFPPEVVAETLGNNPPSKPFAGMLAKLFAEVTGFNPRRKYTQDLSDFEERPFVKHAREAQQIVMLGKQKEQRMRKVTEDVELIEYELEDDWLAGMIGTLEIPGKPTALATVRPDDLTQVVIIKRPSRNMKDPDLSPERYEQALQRAREILKKGVPLNKVQAPSPIFVGAKAVLISGSDADSGSADTDELVPEDYWVIETEDGDTIPWEEAKHIELTVPVHKPIKWSMRTALTFVGDGIEKNAAKRLEKLIAETPANVLRRVLTYIATFSPKIEMNRVSREGGGTYYAVVFEDVGATQFLLRLSSIYPAALRPKQYQPGQFIVPEGPVLWGIARKLRKRLTGVISKKVTAKWKSQKLADKKKRKLWVHQTEAISDMQAQHNSGGRGNFLWMKVGMGKTLVVLKYLTWLISKGQLPKYVVYTLPQSAIKSVVEELRAFGFKVQIIIPIKSLKDKDPPKGADITVTQQCEFAPFTINIIEHDYLRRCEQELVELAPNSIFIIDEVHKALNETKRTSVAREISQLSREFIALTGTPIVNSNTANLMWWLAQIVPFEVNDNNFWVAANTMVAKKASTGIKIDWEEPLAKFSKDEKAKYIQYVPPLLGGTNTSPTMADWKAAADVCYKATDRQMIADTVGFLKKGRGVMMVAKDAAHQARLKALLVKTKR